MSDPCSLGFDLFFFILGLWFLLTVARWGVRVLVPEIKGLFTEAREGFKAPPPKKPRARKAPQLAEGKVFQVGSMDGRNEIVHGKDEDEARRVGAESLRVREEDVVVAEVYDKVIARK